MKYLLSIFFLSVLTLFCLGKPPLKPNDHSNKPFTSNLISPIYHNPKINSKEIITVRHGTTYAMEELKIQGDLDTKEYRLNDLGKKESKRVANQLKEKHSNIHTIISCNKKRCIETAAQIHTKFSSASVWHESDRARGTNMGKLNGKKVNETFFDNPNWRKNVKGIEDEKKVQSRYKDLLKDLISFHPHQSKSEHLIHVAGPEIPQTANPGSPHRTVLVAHQWTNQAIADLIHNDGKNAKLGNGVEMNKKEVPGGYSVIHFNNPDSFLRNSKDGRVKLKSIPKDQVLIKKKGDI